MKQKLTYKQFVQNGDAWMISTIDGWMNKRLKKEYIMDWLNELKDEYNNTQNEIDDFKKQELLVKIKTLNEVLFILNYKFKAMDKR